MATLIDLLSATYAPVQMLILEHLDIAAIIAFSRTAKELNLMPLFKATAHNLNHQFRHYFSNPVEFRKL